MELLHDIIEEGDHGQLKDLISDRLRWRQDSKWESQLGWLNLPRLPGTKTHTTSDCQTTSGHSFRRSTREGVISYAEKDCLVLYGCLIGALTYV